MSILLTGSLLAPNTSELPLTLDPGNWVTGGPLVSCLMVTRGKLFPGRYAIECFQRQTYPNRELLVVIDAPESELIAHLEGLNDERIRLIQISGEKKALGDLRNISVSHARGEYVCQWDDDDLYDPDRIRIQLSALLASQASACILKRWTLWWPAARKLAISRVRLWEGSILVAKAALPAYPGLRRGEDSEMVEYLMRHTRIFCLEAPELYVYIHHGNNTFDKQHFFKIYHFSKNRWINTEYSDKLESLAKRLPIREYLDDYQRNAPDKQPEPDGLADSFPAPLVSIIVRSMGRPELRLALESLSRQDYPNLEVIVVDATGGSHPPLPDIPWKQGHRLRMVGGERRLPRPLACNVGLDAVRGEWFGFLDDDDTCDPGHITDLILASHDHPDALVIYGPARLLDKNDEVRYLFGAGFNRAIMFHGPLFYWQAALIRRKTLDLGCRFDERLDVCEDRDLLAQIAELGDFAFAPGAINFNYRSDLGTSGTGQESNRDLARLLLYDQLLQAKWAGSGTYHSQRALRYNQRAFHAYALGDKSGAESLFLRVLAEYPDDPNALNGLGYILFERGETDQAEAMFRRAISINLSAGEYRLNLATLLEQTGHLWAARREAWLAASDIRVQEPAQLLLDRLGGPPPHQVSPARPSSVIAPHPSRMGPCPCGSGKRYKQCCGQLTANPPNTNKTEIIATQAIHAFRAGEADTAVGLLADCPATGLTRAATAMACGNICTELARYEQAYAFFRQAAALGETKKIGEALTTCCWHWYKAERDISMRRMLHKQIDRLNSNPDRTETGASTREPAHIITILGRIGGSEHRALGLFKLLGEQTNVRLWSLVAPTQEYAGQYPIEVINPEQGHYPTAGHLIFIGIHYDFGVWLDKCRPTRVTICCNSDTPDALITRLIQLEEIPTGFTLDFTFPSTLFKSALGLPGAVEYPFIDTKAFSPGRHRTGQTETLVIGRHSRDEHLKFHPNDPAFYRELARAGHRVRIAGGMCLSHAIGRDTADKDITLIPESPAGMAEFLQGLDCFIYRIHPHLFETGGTSIMEAMAMALPVIIFADRIGVAELIEHGRNGFLVDTEVQALACIRLLAENPGLRRSMGDAARGTIIEVMKRQKAASRDFYLRTRQVMATPLSLN